MIYREIKWLMPLQGDLDEYRLFLFSACDSKYLGYAVSLIRSVDLFSPGFTFVLHLINPDKKSLERLNNLVGMLKNTVLAVSIEHIELSELNSNQKKAYYASARFPQLAKLLPQFNRPIFSLDVDSLVVNPIDHDFSDKPDAEVIVIRRDLTESTPEHLVVATGSIWFKPTSGVVAFLERIANDIDERIQERRLQWFVDQVLFAQHMQIMQKEVRFYNLKRKYADWDFHETSIVWAGKGPRKENDMRFFLLQSLLSDDDSRRDVASQLWFCLSKSEDEASRSQWMHNRIATAIIAIEKVAIYVPRLDLPWKRIDSLSSSVPLLSEDALNLRLYWKTFAIRMANAIERAGLPVDVIEIPAWQIDRETIDASGASLALIPHRCRHDFKEGTTPVLFYMQEFFRWVFVLDESGWSAASSRYPVKLESLPENKNHEQPFDLYRQRLLDGNLGSKFSQSNRVSRVQLIAKNSIPVQSVQSGSCQIRPYIFFPLQIPHDQSIQYFSDFQERIIVEALVNWAKSRDIAVVMKPHPANRKSMVPFEALADGRNIFWSEAHIFDLIEHSQAVYTLNSGVGFESLLQLKPVVTFARVEYDCVTFRSTPETLDDAWAYCRHTDISVLEKRYRLFFNWFLGDYAVDMSRPEHAKATLQKLAVDIVRQVRTKN